MNDRDRDHRADHPRTTDRRPTLPRAVAEAGEAQARRRRTAALGLWCRRSSSSCSTPRSSKALLSIQADPASARTEAGLVVNAYVVTFGGLLPGRVADLLGRRRACSWRAPLLFTAGTPSWPPPRSTRWVLAVAGRVVQGGRSRPQPGGHARC